MTDEIALDLGHRLAAAAGGEQAAAAASLTAGEQAMLEELLGQGVVGAPVAGETLTPEFAPLRDGTWSYQIVGGEDAGQTEQHLVKRLDRDPSSASWRYAVGDKSLVFIKQMSDGSLTFVTEENSDAGRDHSLRAARAGSADRPGAGRQSHLVGRCPGLGPERSRTS